MEIAFLTSNDTKVSVGNEHLSKYNIMLRKVPFEFKEVQLISVNEVARDKIMHAIPKMNCSFIVEDTGFYAKALNGFPGVLFKYVFDTLGHERFLKLMENESDRRASVFGVVIYYDKISNTIKEFEGDIKGKITHSVRGHTKNGILSGRIFIPDNYDKTFAEMDQNEWNKFMCDIALNGESDFENFGKWIAAGHVLGK